MANGSVPAGIQAERALVDGLRKLGFQIIAGKRLDEELKADGIITALPMPEQTLFYPPPIAIQVTTRRSHWDKRVDFVLTAKVLTKKLIYIEICGPVSPEMIFMASSALTHLFCCENVSRNTLVTLTSTDYKIADMDELLSQYQKWISTLITGRISGRITRWMTEGGFGFITATVIGPSGTSEEINFFVHHSSVNDVLSQRLSTSDGKANIPVTFEDGGVRSEDEQKRKTAVRVQPA